MKRYITLTVLAAISLLALVQGADAQIMLGMSKPEVIKKHGKTKLLAESTPTEENDAHLQLVSYKIDGVDLLIVYSNIHLQEVIEKKGDVVKYTHTETKLDSPEVTMILMPIGSRSLTTKETYKIFERFTGVKEWVESMMGFLPKKGTEDHDKNIAPEGNNAAMASVLQESFDFGDFSKKGPFLLVALPQ